VVIEMKINIEDQIEVLIEDDKIDEIFKKKR
jgi:hypothetical protein